MVFSAVFGVEIMNEKIKDLPRESENNNGFLVAGGWPESGVVVIGKVMNSESFF